MDAGVEDGEGLLGLSDVLAYSGLSKLVLHAWERRYGLAPEVRSHSGRRFYTRAQAERFKLLKLCTDAGYRIGSLIDVPQSQLARLIEAQSATAALGPLMDATEALDGEKLRALLQARADQDGPERFVRTTVFPLLQEIGARWATGGLSVAAEHLATATAKRILGSMMDRSGPAEAGAPCLIATTPEGEEHEIGAMVVALLARMRGWDTLFLGPNLPNRNIIEAALARGASHVCLSALHGKPGRLQRQLRDLRAGLPADIVIWTGGPGYAEMPEIEGVSFVSHIDDLAQRLDRAGPFPQ